jgi:hypothetical protein
MKPFDDMIPEEIEPQHKELLSLLHHVYRRPAPVTAAEQEQIIGGVREHLLHSSSSAAPEDLPVQPSAGITSQSQALSPATARRRGRVFHLINMLAAVLVVGVIIGASLLLFTHRPQPGRLSPPAGPTSTPVTVHTGAGGLEASMSLTPGPYFLSELLVTDISLTNHTHTTFMLEGPPVANACGSALYITVTGGGAPHYTVPVEGIPSCPAMQTRLEPDHTLTIHQYLPLTNSGQVTLTAGARFLITKLGPQGEETTIGSSPLDGHWPSIQINVTSQVPPDRMLSLQQQGSQVLINAPSAARRHLLYMYIVTCEDFQGPGSTATGNFFWESISTNILHEPGCPGKNVHWTYAVSAPGYAIAAGNYPSS